MLQAGSGFLSQHSKEVFFDPREAKVGPVRAFIRWPSDQVQELHDLPINPQNPVDEGTEPSRMEIFNSRGLVMPSPPRKEPSHFPAAVETWLPTPVVAPAVIPRPEKSDSNSRRASRGKPALNFWVEASASCREDLKLFNRCIFALGRNGSPAAFDGEC